MIGGREGLKVSGSGFAGAKASAGAEGALVWKRQDDYSDVASAITLIIFPGEWDDRMVDRIPDGVLERLSKWIFGTGDARLVTGKAGVDVRAGVGADAGAGFGVEKDGLIQLESQGLVGPRAGWRCFCWCWCEPRGHRTAGRIARDESGQQCLHCW